MSRSKPRHLKKRRPLSSIAELLRSVKLLAYERQRMSVVDPSLADEEQEEPKYAREHNHPDYYGDSLADDEGDVVIRRAAEESILAPLPDWAGQSVPEPSISFLWEIHQLPKAQEPSSEPISDQVEDSLNEAVNASEDPAQPAQEAEEPQPASPKSTKKGTKPYMIDRKNHVRVRETDGFVGDVYRRLEDGRWMARHYPSALVRNAKFVHPGGDELSYRTRAEAAESLWKYHLSLLP